MLFIVGFYNAYNSLLKTNNKCKKCSYLTYGCKNCNVLDGSCTECQGNLSLNTQKQCICG